VCFFPFVTAAAACTQVCFGSVGEVRRFEEYLYGNSPRFSTANELEVSFGGLL
jgi:hypothetical protein